MDLNELQSVRDRERQTDKLQQLRESFYADAGSFIQQLHAERDRAVERADDPFDSPEVRQLTDEIKTAEQTVEAIYEKRVGKIVKAASFAAADLPAESDGMTAEEQELFDDLVGNIKANRERVLALLDGDEPPTDTDTPAPTEGDEPAAAGVSGAPEPAETPAGWDETAESDSVTAADAMGGAPSPETEPAATGDAASQTNEPRPPADEAVPPSADPVDPPVRNDGGTATEQPQSDTDEAVQPDIERQRVQILDDVETFLGFDDRDYDLEPDDVVSLPAGNADILLEQGVAREL
ncbi:DNA replication factor GINS [Halovenus aranensis]|uniref:DNA replication factor GINS n=1 Tax=Halovenus aranensis TaxID=890420 RepID=A0A1G8SZP6_9EURY|nr:hypothetical protein [Halovenus aranensis]SDJ34030.1 DNA replication factor GINS [Halovenus aranensis]